MKTLLFFSFFPPFFHQFSFSYCNFASNNLFLTIFVFFSTLPHYHVFRPSVYTFRKLIGITLYLLIPSFPLSSFPFFNLSLSFHRSHFLFIPSLYISVFSLSHFPSLLPLFPTLSSSLLSCISLPFVIIFVLIFQFLSFPSFISFWAAAPEGTGEDEVL